MKKLLIITDTSFPSGSAMASRIISFCHLFNDIGYEIHVIAGKTEDKEKKEDAFYTYEIAQSSRSFRLQSYLGNENLAKCVDDYLSNNDVDLVFSTSMNINFRKVFDIVKKHNKKIILEQCEWFDPSSFRFKKFDLRYIKFLNNLNKHYLIVDGVISISKLLNNYYLNKGIKTIRIPSILDVKNKRFNEKTNNKKIKLVYTGNASKSKEIFKPILEAIYEFKDLFELDIYGLDIKKLIKNIGNNEELYKKVKNNVKVYGQVSQDKIEEILLNADYQIFIRPSRKSSNAGFPTKLCESMSVGTPVVTNNTGDICDYLVDGINGYVSKGTETRDIIEVFDRILKENKSLRKQARKTAEECFDYRIYKDEVKGLIESV